MFLSFLPTRSGMTPPAAGAAIIPKPSRSTQGASFPGTILKPLPVHDNWDSSSPLHHTLHLRSQRASCARKKPPPRLNRLPRPLRRAGRLSCARGGEGPCPAGTGPAARPRRFPTPRGRWPGEGRQAAATCRPRNLPHHLPAGRPQRRRLCPHGAGRALHPGERGGRRRWGLLGRRGRGGA